MEENFSFYSCKYYQSKSKINKSSREVDLVYKKFYKIQKTDWYFVTDHFNV